MRHCGRRPRWGGDAAWRVLYYAAATGAPCLCAATACLSTPAATSPSEVAFPALCKLHPTHLNPIPHRRLQSTPTAQTTPPNHTAPSSHFREMLTKDLIKHVSGEYDLEMVQTLKLVSLELPSIMSLESCLNLRDLNLSSNSITEVSGLKTLSNLLRLDLSCNKITLLREKCFDGLSSLEFLSLEGNAIADVDNVNALSSLSGTLRTVYFQSYYKEFANPLVAHPTYLIAVLRAVPKLANLDGESLELREAAGGEIFLDVKPDPKYLVDLPVEDWLSDCAETRELTNEGQRSIMDKHEVKDAVEGLQDVLHEVERELARAKGLLKNADADLAMINAL